MLCELSFITSLIVRLVKKPFQKLFRLRSENGHKLDSHRKHYSSASLKQRNFSFNDTLLPSAYS